VLNHWRLLAVNEQLNLLICSLACVSERNYEVLGFVYAGNLLTA
jgi:hypothetical protein